MGVRARMITIDTTDPQRLAAFWSSLLELPVARDTGNYVYLARGIDGDPVISFQRVPEPTPGKNRVHLDLEGPPKIEVPRAVALGATVIAEFELPDTAWTILADPDGNQFCIGLDN